jgi:hypothetical protein
MCVFVRYGIRPDEAKTREESLRSARSFVKGLIFDIILRMRTFALVVFILPLFACAREVTVDFI